MFPGGMNPAKMQGMMKKMGISQTQLPVRRVVFEMAEGNLVIEDPAVIKIMMQGQESYQVTGEAVEESVNSFSDEDVTMVVSQTGKSEEEVKAARDKTTFETIVLKKSGLSPIKIDMMHVPAGSFLMGDYICDGLDMFYIVDVGQAGSSSGNRPVVFLNRSQNFSA